MSRTLPLLLLALALVAAAPASAQCPGDCDGDGVVRIDELLASVGRALGTGDPDRCVVADADENGAVSIAEIIAAVDAALDGCPDCSTQPGGCPPTPFDFATSDAVTLSLRVTIDGAPAAGAIVTVTDPLPLPQADELIEDLSHGAVYFQGAADADGRVAALLKIPTAVGRVDVIVNYPDATGPYAVEPLRAFWGPFAPSARVNLGRDEIASAEVALTADAPIGAELRRGAHGLPLAAQAVAAPREAVPGSLNKLIGQILPEQSSAGASFVSDVYSPNLVVTETATVSVTFMFEGAGYQNTLGYFTYRENLDGTVTILSSDLLFPNASFPPQGSMQVGDTVVLGDASGKPRIFQPGERVGFFLVANGWVSDPRIKRWAYSLPGIPDVSGAVNQQSGYGCYTTLNQTNPEFAAGRDELSRHVAMVRMNGIPGFLGGKDFFLTGFEDQNRGASDNDFNDLVVVVTATPFTAIAESEVLPFEAGDPDRDGVSGTNDHYPTDPDRAFVVRYPSSGSTVVACEDQYPQAGDTDYNDAVIAYDFQVVTNSAGAVKDIVGTFHLLARGAGYDHALGVHIPGLPADAAGTLQVERFLSGDAPVRETDPERAIATLVADDARRVTLLPSTTAALPPLPGRVYTNTKSETPERPPASVRMHLTFDRAVPAAALGVVPYDLYLDVVRGAERWDIHFPGQPGFSDRPAHLPVERGTGSFLDPNGFPFLIELPTEWRFPLELVAIDAAYPSFTLWRTSRGASARTWYLSPTSKPGRIAKPLATYLPVRDWTVRLPSP